MLSKSLALFSLLSLTVVSAGSHDGFVLRSAHRHRRAVDDSKALYNQKRGCTERSDSSSCSDGAWQCSGTQLQQCTGGSWNTVQDCQGDNVVCSASSSATGCVWSWSVNGDSSSNSSDSGELLASVQNDLSSSSTSATTSPSTSSSSANASPTSGGSPSSSQFNAPHYAIYADNFLSTMPSASDVSPYNRFILAFWLTSGAADDAEAWEQLDQGTRQQVLDDYHSAGIALMVSAFGSTDTPTSSGADASQTAQQLASWVKQFGLDGVDIDYEDLAAFNDGSGVQWLIDFQTELRNQLPAGQFLISHAPVAPWFTSAKIYSQGGYVGINSQVGSSIDWYNIQFYNQGQNVYTTCQTLITDSGGNWPSTSVMEIHSSGGVELNKIVIGKPNDAAAASNGFMDPSTLGQCVSQAKSQGWNGGVMFWEWASDAISNINAVIG